MHRIAAVVMCLLIVLNAKGSVAQSSPIPITDCGYIISHPVNYVLQNGLVLAASVLGVGEGGNCLTISSSHVRIDMKGRTITVACPSLSSSSCPGELGLQAALDRFELKKAGRSRAGGAALLCAAGCDDWLAERSEFEVQVSDIGTSRRQLAVRSVSTRSGT